MTDQKVGVLLINLGTPDSPTIPDVRKYLREFLMDGRVIDIPFTSRWILVNLIIAPFRAPKSTKVYQELWTENGSPLLYFGRHNEKSLQEILGEKYIVKLGMRYQNPSIREALDHLYQFPLSSLIILPLFPQYASATTGSVHQKVMDILSKWNNLPELKFVKSYFDHPLFTKAFSETAKRKLEGREFDYMLFSYHGLPERQIYKSSFENFCELGSCCNSFHSKNINCYRAQCFETSRILADALNIPDEKYKVVFQSRLGKEPWIQPYAEDVIRSLPKQGKKKVAVMVPSFVADCLETIIEVGEEFKEIFLEAGGKEWIFIESLNDSDTWLECLYSLVKTAKLS